MEFEEGHVEVRRQQISELAYARIVQSNWRVPFVRAYLQISPTYRLAHLAANDELDNAIQLPNDFSVAQLVYDDLGDVWSLSDVDWWMRSASPVFENPIKKQPHLVETLGPLPITGMDEFDAQHLNVLIKNMNTFTWYLNEEYASLGFPQTALIAVPIEGSIKDAKHETGELIDAAFKTMPGSHNAAKYAISSKNRIHAETMAKCLFAAIARAQFEDLTLSQVGDLVDYRFEHEKLGSYQQQQVRENKSNQTSELVRNALRLSEWAARGDFFSKGKLNQVTSISSAEDGVPNIQPYRVTFDYEFIRANIANGTIQPLVIE